MLLVVSVSVPLCFILYYGYIWLLLSLWCYGLIYKGERVRVCHCSYPRELTWPYPCTRVGEGRVKCLLLIKVYIEVHIDGWKCWGESVSVMKVARILSGCLKDLCCTDGPKWYSPINIGVVAIVIVVVLTHRLMEASVVDYIVGE